MNIYDEIIPAKSLGGIRLKDNIKKYSSIINKNMLIGMPINDILNSNLGFYYDECEEAFFSKIIEGIALEVSEDDPPFEEALKMNIKYISVFDPTAFDQ